MDMADQCISGLLFQPLEPSGEDRLMRWLMFFHLMIIGLGQECR